MEKVFKDKIRTEDTLRSAAALVKEIAATNALSKWIDGLAEDCNRIGARSAVAHNSTMHYNIANDAAYLYERISALNWVAQSLKWLTSDNISHGKRCELLGSFSGQIETVLEDLRPVRASNSVAWDVVIDYKKAAERLFAAVSGACQEVWKQQRAEMNSWLEEDVDPDRPLPVKYHDAFVARIENHDHYFSYSDDINTYRRGTADRDAILKIVKRHPHYAKLWQIAEEMSDGRHGNAKEHYRLRRLECQH